MARKKADQTRDAAESGEDRSAVLTDDHEEDTASSTVTDTGDTASDREDVADEHDDADETALESDDDRVDDADDAGDTDDEPSTVVDDDIDDLDDDEDFDDLDDERDGPGRPAFLVTLGVAIVAVLGVLFLLGAFVWPAFLGPGSPEDTANRAVTALGAKDEGQLGQISCVRLDGQPAAAFPPELLALIGNAAPSGPAVQTLDTEARAPIDLTLTQGGQSQTLPADLLLGVSGGDWCLNGISQRQ